MDKSFLLDSYIPDEKELLAYGFKKQGSAYSYLVKASAPGFSYSVLLNPPSLEIKVIEDSSQEEYAPFSLSGQHGDFVLGLQEEGDKLLSAILLKCFRPNQMKEKVIKYAQEKYKALLESPWSDYPDYITIKRTDNRKWFGLLMEVPYKSFGLNKDGNAAVLNLKADPLKIPELWDNKTIYPSYHMNKKYWLSLLLIPGLDEKVLFDLIDSSYGLTGKGK